MPRKIWENYWKSSCPSAGTVCKSDMGMLYFMHLIVVHYFFSSWKFSRCMMHDVWFIRDYQKFNQQKTLKDDSVLKRYLCLSHFQWQRPQTSWGWVWPSSILVGVRFPLSCWNWRSLWTGWTCITDKLYELIV